MQNEVLEKIKKEFRALENARGDQDNDIQRIRELERDDKIKEYRFLLEKVRTSPQLSSLSDDDLLSLPVRNNLGSITVTNGIYVYLGTYKRSGITDIEHGPIDHLVPYDSPQAEFREYQDIEREHGFELPIEKCAEFEKSNVVIYPENPDRSSVADVQKEFFRTAVFKGQSAAKKKVLERFPSNQK